MQARVCRAAVLLMVLSAIAASTAAAKWPEEAAASATRIPFNGLKLIYDANLPILSLNPVTSFSGIVSFQFSEVTETFSTVTVNVQGTLMVGQRSQVLNAAQSIKLATDRDTALFLLPQTDPSLGAAVHITGVTISLDSWQVDLSGDFLYEGAMPISTHLGTFSTYRLHNKTQVNEATVDTYLHYEKSTKLMIYGELNAQSTLFSYRYTFKLKEANLPFTEGTTGGLPRSECLIATAAFGSDLSTEVQSLRSFRDSIVLSTSSGSQFMKAFNAWYYSFSPKVADVIRGSEVERGAARVFIYPLIGVLKVTTALYNVVSLNKEGAIILSGLAASSLIGLIYFTLPTTAILFVLSKIFHLSLKSGALRHILAFQVCSLGLTYLGVTARSSPLLMVSTPALVLSTITAVSGYTAFRIVGLK